MVQQQEPSIKAGVIEQSDRAASALLGAVGNALRLCNVEAPTIGSALRDIFIADARLFLAPIASVTHHLI